MNTTGHGGSAIMSHHRELLTFLATLTALVVALFHESLLGGKVLSPSDAILVSRAFEPEGGPDYEPANRLLIDRALQTEPWLEFSRAQLRQGRLPLWNPLVGCGAPHLANGQSAVFDPFHLIAYLGTLPDAHAPIAAARLIVAGLGMFLLARRWRLGAWGRWFAGLSYPFCGFMIVWLLFPVAPVAVWMPWAFLATQALLDGPSARSVAIWGGVVGVLLVSGHIQTAAHVLLATGLFVLWCRPTRRGLIGWSGGFLLGVGLSAAAVLPLGCYLTRSPVWVDRLAAQASWLTLSPPRILDALTTAFPYLLGSQRYGHPNLARAVGAHNLNESAGGFAGLATLVWLAPLGLVSTPREPRARFLAVLTLLGGAIAFEAPPIANLVRIVPVLNVIDHRRLTLWVAFGLVLLGAIGLDRLRSPDWRYRSIWLAGALGLALLAVSIAISGPGLRAYAIAHYDRAAVVAPGVDRAILIERAERQASRTTAFVPRYALACAGQLLVLAALAWGIQRGRVPANGGRSCLLAITLADLLAFGYGYNPAIARDRYRPSSPLIERLRELAVPPARVLVLDPELPPNTLMRYGLADLRNYDSIEMARSLAYLGPLFEPGPTRTSRRAVTWDGVTRAYDRLRNANVAVVVGNTPPPDGRFEKIERIGSLWITRLSGSRVQPQLDADGRVRVVVPPDLENPTALPIAFDPGWRASAGGRPINLRPDPTGSFLAVGPSPDSRELVLEYKPPEVRLGLILSGGCLLLTGLMLVSRTGARSFPKTWLGAWSARSDPGRIGAMSPVRPKSPAISKEHHADDPLHV